MNLRFPLPQMLPRLLLAGAALALVGARPILAQSDGEWFDPTDWFDAKNVKALSTDKYGVYEYDYAYGLGENFDYAVWSTYDRWEAKDYNAGFWDKHTWSGDTASLARPSGKPIHYAIYAEPQRKSDAQRDQQAAKTEDRTKKQSQVAQKEGQPQEGRKQVARLDGKIEGLSNVQLRRESGATNTYTIAKVRMGQAKTTVVNLGREALVKDLNLKQGDAIEAIGRRGKIQNQEVFVAHRLKAGNRTIDANPTIRLAQTDEAGKSPSSGKQPKKDQETLTGTVARVKKAPASSGRPEHTLVELKLKSGKSATVDLGPAASLEKIGLKQGERVIVRGQAKEQEGRKLIIPDLLKIEDARVAASDSE